VSQQGLLISVRSGVNARPSRRLINQPTDADPDRGRAKSATPHALNLISLRMTGRDRLGRPSESRQCATRVQPAFLPWLRNKPAKGREASDPCIGTTNRKE
jgi:hypothetical protein